MKKQIIKSSKVADPEKYGGAWSQAIKVGNLLFLSGAAAEDEKREILGKGDIEVQARQTFRNIEAVLEAAGASLKDVVKITAFLTRLEDFPKYNEVRRQVFKNNFPASTTVIIKSLAREDYLLEVESIAIVPER